MTTAPKYSIGQTVYYAGEGEGGEVPGAVTAIDYQTGVAIYTVAWSDGDVSDMVTAELTDYRCTGCGTELENPGRLSVCYTCQHNPDVPTTYFAWAW